MYSDEFIRKRLWNFKKIWEKLYENSRTVTADFEKNFGTFKWIYRKF